MAVNYFHLHRCLQNRYHVACSAMASVDSKEKENHLVRSSVVEVELLCSLLVLIFYLTEKREESHLPLAFSNQWHGPRPLL